MNMCLQIEMLDSLPDSDVLETPGAGLWKLVLCIFPQVCAPCQHAGGLKWAMERVSTPQRLTNARDQGFLLLKRQLLNSSQHHSTPGESGW